MFASSTIPQLQLIRNRSPKAKMENVVAFEAEVGKFDAENQAKLEELRRLRIELTTKAALLSTGLAAGIAFFSAAVLPVLGAIMPMTELLAKCQGASQRFFIMEALIQAFEEDIAIEVGLQPEGLREIDLFLRFPDKEFVLIQIRSLGNSKIVFDERIEALRFRRQKGGFKVWEPSPLHELAEQERWLRKHRSDLLGTSSRDRRRPFAKLLVIWDDAFTFLGEHPEHLYVTVDDQKFLTIRTMGTISVVMRNRVTDFVRAYLSSRRSPKAFLKD